MCLPHINLPFRKNDCLPEIRSVWIITWGKHTTCVGHLWYIWDVLDVYATMMPQNLCFEHISMFVSMFINAGQPGTNRTVNTIHNDPTSPVHTAQLCSHPPLLWRQTTCLIPACQNNTVHCITDLSMSPCTAHFVLTERSVHTTNQTNPNTNRAKHRCQTHFLLRTHCSITSLQINELNCTYTKLNQTNTDNIKPTHTPNHANTNNQNKSRQYAFSKNQHTHTHFGHCIVNTDTLCYVV